MYGYVYTPRTEKIRLNHYLCPNFRNGFTGVPVHLKQVFTGVVELTGVPLDLDIKIT